MLGRLSGVRIDLDPGNAEGSSSGVPFGEHIAPGGWLTPDKKKALHNHYKAGEWNKLRIGDAEKANGCLEALLARTPCPT